MRPGMLSTAVAALIIGPFFIRCSSLDISRVSGGCLLMVICDTFLCSTIVSIFLSSKATNILWLSISPITFLFGCVLFSWAGMRSLAGLMWIVLFIDGMTHATQLNIAMDFSGAIYIVCTLVSFIFQYKLFYADDFIESINKDFFRGANRVRGDITSSVETAKDAAKKAGDVVKDAAKAAVTAASHGAL